MQFRNVVVLGLLAAADAQSNSPTGRNSDTNNAPTTVIDVVTRTSAGNNNGPTTSANNNNNNGGSSSSTGGSGSGDVTVTQTTTVTNGDAKTVSRKTTILQTVTSTIVVTKTALETTTVTSSDAETATETVVTTVTTTANAKRALAPRTVDGAGNVVEARATQAPEYAFKYLRDLDEESGEQDVELIRRKRELVKRATITKMVTVTDAGNSAKTVMETDTQTVVSTTKKETEITSTLTKTIQANAKTTITTTSTFVVTETPVNTAANTQSEAPTGSVGPPTGGGNKDEGLSTGAKAGIGAGAGVAGLAILGGLLWFFLRKRSRGPKVDEDDLFGSSEVPVGGSGPSHGPPPNMAQTSAAAAAHLVPGRVPTKPTAQEGYRGTALGDGRAGFAKPQQYGSAYNNSVSPETAYSRTATTSPGNGPDMLPEHPSPEHPKAAELGQEGHNARWHQPNAQEIDGQQVTSTTGSAPPPQVYEMPTQQFR